ncbi:hypothetical protein JT328_gp43 [Aeromonas phage BUCT551]|uniref:Uncharacterized protein n=2 Tax=Sharonstreetvirus TaxID=2943019 RepID=A0AAE9YK44_9CAUD|nr:hypothetical protein JT328_gp43 [Aeromonas phage BUCT551]QOI69659.1 hypothetical protein [Aeromonas phage BUCT551]UIS24842.1 hypothetical protein pAEv1812_33 [Aeromonas phage pAEv1812]WCZ66105.1 hypothetical protein phiA034_gene0022 [Aeromonas phage phiA034]
MNLGERVAAATGSAIETGGKVSTVALGLKGAANEILNSINIQLPSLPELAVMLPVVVSALWAIKLSLDIGFSIWDRIKGRTGS